MVPQARESRGRGLFWSWRFEIEVPHLTEAAGWQIPLSDESGTHSVLMKPPGFNLETPDDLS